MSTWAAVKVTIPEGCAAACPHGGPSICGRNVETKQLGTFENECTFGRYNSCHKIKHSMGLSEILLFFYS